MQDLLLLTQLTVIKYKGNNVRIVHENTEIANSCNVTRKTTEQYLWISYTRISSMKNYD